MLFAGGRGLGVAGVCGQFFIRSARLERGLYHPAAHPFGRVLMLLLVAGLEGAAEPAARVCFRAEPADVLVFGVLGIGLCQYSYYTTIRAANATTATILCYLGPKC